MGYYDGGEGREGFEPGERCQLHGRCALRGGHGGGCDPRPEPERFRAMYAAMDEGLRGDALHERLEADARRALARATKPLAFLAVGREELADVLAVVRVLDERAGFDFYVERSPRTVFRSWVNCSRRGCNCAACVGKVRVLVGLAWRARRAAATVER